MMKHIYLIIGVMLLLVSCNGRQHTAENAVAEFMAENLSNAKDMKITNFSRLDSTNKVKDSVIVVLRKQADATRKVCDMHSLRHGKCSSLCASATSSEKRNVATHTTSTSRLRRL